MLSLITRSLVTKCPLRRFSSGITQKATTLNHRTDEQLQYINSVIDNSPFDSSNSPSQEVEVDWPTLKSNVLSHPGNITQKNYEGVVLKIMVNHRKYDTALSFVNHLKSNCSEMTLGAINGILGLYYYIGLARKLSEEEKMFIMDSYKSLYDKYKVLDFSTCERLVRALCVVDEWEKAIWVLEDIHLSSVPSHTAFSVLIGTLFRNNKKKRAFEVINESIKHKRPLQYEAFDEWIKFIFRKTKDRKTILKHLSEIHDHIARNYAVIDEGTANKLKETYTDLGWDTDFTKILKNNGECIKCNERLDHLKLSDEEFTKLQQNVKEKLIIKSDLFLNSSPDELKRFSGFLEETGPYDVVIDALNVAFALGRNSNADKMEFLLKTVSYFKDRRKRILVLGRKHMVRWGKGSFDKLSKNVNTFFTNDISQDDPYFITAAILSGPQTDIVSKDLLRGHQFNLQDEDLKYIFKKWQWQHQWMVFVAPNRGVKVQPPLKFTPCAQKNSNNGGWHLPYQSKDSTTMGLVNDGTPDLLNWLCIRRKENK